KRTLRVESIDCQNQTSGTTTDKHPRRYSPHLQPLRHILRSDKLDNGPSQRSLLLNDRWHLHTRADPLLRCEDIQAKERGSRPRTADQGDPTGVTIDQGDTLLILGDPSGLKKHLEKITSKQY